ncbi:MAG: hypothetical protein ACRDNM_00070 [Gaiellaceae bacterium]
MSPIVAAARELVHCRHDAGRELRAGIAWCPRCGALRFEGGGGDWFRPSGAAAVAVALGPLQLSPSGRRCFEYVDAHPYGMALDDVVATFGMRAVFELVQADLLRTDELRRVATVPPPADDGPAGVELAAAAGDDLARPSRVVRVVRP